MVTVFQRQYEKSFELVVEHLFSSPELKTQVKFSDRLSSVCLSTVHMFIFFSRTITPFSTKLGTKHPWVKRIQVYSNDGPHPFPKGDSYVIVKTHWQKLMIFFSRTSMQISKNLCTKHFWVKGIRVCSMKGQSPFPRGKILK